MSMSRSDFFASLCATVLAFFGLRKPEPEVAGTKAWKCADGDKFIFKTTANTADPIEPGVVRDRLSELDVVYTDGDGVIYVSVPNAPIELTLREPVTVSRNADGKGHHSDTFLRWSTDRA